MSHARSDVQGRGPVVVGVGNLYRCDDAAGIHVLRRLEGRVADGVRLVECDGEATRLLDAWAGASLAVVVDAVHTHLGRPGTLHRLVVEPDGRVPEIPFTRGTASSHVLGPGEAVSLGASLGRLPDRLVILGVEGHRFSFGETLSDEVAAACDRVAEAVLAELEAAAGARQGRNGEE